MKHFCTITEIGKLLDRTSVNKTQISRRTGISSSRLSELSLKKSTRLTAEELYLIALAIDIDPGEMFKEIFKDLKLEND
ncbi:helix-turn-helix domain-containing protein [Phaeodactylibacter xiamenensis]|uniref:helix-turn-helix domain-containing protein n=1 Tax=Phaeodactylibacter xiamenensis TaxID=1524460 RepID=UPI003BAD52B1